MRFSVSICTFNRARLLEQCLARLTQLRIPRDVGWEVVVANNCCTDDTDDVVRAFEGRLPVRLVFVAEPGASHARNRLAKEARADWIAWTDDDVLVEVDWLAAYDAAIEAFPSATMFGGPIEPWFEGDPPAWLATKTDVIAHAFALKPRGRLGDLLSSERLLANCANFCIRSEVQRQFRFDPAVGPQPGSEIRGEEVEVIRTALAAGYEGRWVPDALVLHFLPSSRQTLSYLRAYWVGRGEYLALRNPPDGPRLLGSPRWLWRKLVESELAYLVARVRGVAPERWLEQLREASIWRGQWLRSRHLTPGSGASPDSRAGHAG